MTGRMLPKLAAMAATMTAAFLAAGPACATPQEFQQCLNNHGVNVQLPPHPPGNPPPNGKPPAPPGVSQQLWDRALQSCQQYAPAPPPQR